VSDGRTLISVLLAVAGIFTVCASIGAMSWLVAALGVAVLAASVAFYVVSALNSREFAYIPGTAHVVSCSPPPAAAAQGRCEMHLVVHAPGMEDVAVRFRDTGVPVSKWPDAGATLPILVAVGDPRRIRVLWDQVRTHGEMAEGRADEPAEYPAGAVDDAYLDDLLDEDYDAGAPLPDLDPDARVIELDVMDPTLFRSEPAEDAGPGLSRDAQLEPDTALATDAQLSPEVDLAGPDSDPDRPASPPPPPPPRRRPSPRPRRPLDDQVPLVNLDADAGVTTLPHQRPPTEPDGDQDDLAPGAAPDLPPDAAPAPARGEAGASPAALRVSHLLPADPAVAAIPAPDDDPDVSDAYLTVSPPPGQGAHGRVRGVSVTLFVANLGRSVAFYRDLLGFRQVDVGLGSAVLESGDGRIVLRRVVDMAPVDRRLVHLMLEVPDVQAAYDELLLQGVEFVHRPRPVSRYDQFELWSAPFRDPDGHGIALVHWEARR
jgi:catechol 2,3-dioxygenase-like lactoylglutathione lyase family enzyme